MAHADEASDKAEFKKLYAEFNDLYSNSFDIDPIIEIGEKLYRLAPKIYETNHKDTAELTYQLASLYDQKGGMENNTDEQKAFFLYQEYFKTLGALNVHYYLDYVVRYSAFVKAEYNVHTQI